ncbi:MAG: fibronectin type III domain-containing protein [Verrucomicrobiota bacterium]|nr:fibronectin type III domain-containing protein [Verrucomicrobiota bacterium]
MSFLFLTTKDKWRKIGRCFISATITCALAPLAFSASPGLLKEGTEYFIGNSSQGDQVRPVLALDVTGGVLVYEDNVADGDGMGISARRLTPTFAGGQSSFRVNSIGEGDQQNPQAARLLDGSTLFVWQGGEFGQQRIFGRILGSGGIFTSQDFQISGNAAIEQIEPSLASLPNGGAIVVWSARGQDGSMSGVFAQLISSTGIKSGPEFRINQHYLLNQRSASVAAFPNGRILVSWISEGQRHGKSVDIYARFFDEAGNPLSDEFRLNSTDNLASSPKIAPTGLNRFVVAWTEIKEGGDANAWDIVAASFSLNGTAITPPRVINQTRSMAQISPAIANSGGNLLLAWMSFEQDGSQEGVYGRFLNSSADPIGDEFRVNTTVISKQMHPTVGSDETGRFVVAWTTFSGLNSGFDIAAQRFYQTLDQVPLLVPSAPYVSALSQSRLSVTWPVYDGLEIDHFELFVDGSATPILLTNQTRTITGLAPGSEHSFRLLYQLSDGRRSPMSDAGVGKTWGEDLNDDFLPDDWQQVYWGLESAKWPSSTADSDGDGASNHKEFLAGTNPTDPASVLAAEMQLTEQGFRLVWNTQPGLLYQVQSNQNLNTPVWENVGLPRFAVGHTDSIPATGVTSLGYYRVIRIR